MGDFRSSFHTAPEPELPPVRRSPLPSVLAASSLPAHLHLLKSPARVLAGRYQIEGAIGKGSMGTVFRARDLQQGSLCAIKMLHQAALKEEADYQRFANEAEVIAQLFHPNIVEVSEFHRDEQGGPFLVMELLHGIDLHSHLGGGRKLPLSRVQLVVRQVASALHAAHSLGIVHRDIKPRNIFLAQQGGPTGAPTEIVKVVDFGLSKILGGRQHQTAPGEILGTPEYLAPEGTLGRSTLLDERTDQWALAITAYRMLAGQLPFLDEDVVRLMLKIRKAELPPLAAFAVQVPEYVTAALGRALSKRKEDRFPSVLAFARALHGLPEGRAAARQSPAGEPARVAAAAYSEAAGGAAASPLTAEQERQLEQLETTQPIAPQVLDDLLGMSRSGPLRRAPRRARHALLGVCMLGTLALGGGALMIHRGAERPALPPPGAPSSPTEPAAPAAPAAVVDPAPAAELGPAAEPGFQPLLARPRPYLGQRSLLPPLAAEPR